MIALRLDGPDESRVRAVATEAAARARAVAGADVRVLGPAEAPIARLRGRTRWQVWLSAADRAPLTRAARAAADLTLPREVRLAGDGAPPTRPCWGPRKTRGW